MSVQDVNVDFECEVDMMDIKTDSNESTKQSDFENNFSVDASARGGWLWGRAKVNTSYSSSYKVKSTLTAKDSSTSKMNTKATYNFNIRASNEKPEGLNKLLDILQNCITETEQEESIV
jgi:hypothetical protein